MSPQRIQRKRMKGWRMPEGAIYVGRGTRWGNPFDHRITMSDDGIGAAAARRFVVDRYVDYLACAQYEPDYYEGFPSHDSIRDNLAGRDLACWCPLDQPCHADVLLEIANP